jgi:hypothetical protein
MFVRPPSSDARSERPNCTESLVAPAVDSAVATAAFVLGGMALEAAVSPGDEKPGISLPVFFGLVMLGAGASAVHGFRATNRCREAVTSWCGSHDCGEPDAPR